MSTSGDVQYIKGYHYECGGYWEIFSTSEKYND